MDQPNADWAELWRFVIERVCCVVNMMNAYNTYYWSVPVPELFDLQLLGDKTRNSGTQQCV